MGAGSGYFTAILAELVGPTGSVTAFEVDAPLAAAAAENLRRWPHVRVEPSSGVIGATEPADLIYVSASLQQPPRAWFDALAPGGRLVFPLTPGADEGGMFLVRRLTSSTVFDVSFLCRARFVPCKGAGDETAYASLRSAFANGGFEAVRTLRLDPEVPDETAWFRGRDWWLSRRPPA